MAAALIEQARTVIGQNAPGDYVIDPTGHAAQLGESAPGLADILKSSQLFGVAEKYVREDADARQAQDCFKAAMKNANWAVLGATAANATMMAVSGLGLPYHKELVVGLAFVGGLCAIFGRFIILRIKDKNLLDKWMSGRASAETCRVDYFKQVTSWPCPSKGQPFSDLLKLEYFRRYHLDVQCDYYRLRAKDHERADERSSNLRATAVTLTSVVSLAVAVFSAMDPRVTALGALGVIFTAVAAYAAAGESVTQDRRNAERYRRTHLALEQLRGRLDSVREGVSRGEHALLPQYVAAVNDLTSVEHKQWLDARSAPLSSMVELERSLTHFEEMIARAEPAKKPKGR